ncbi:MAG: hypothetical protein GF341_07705 [candidate division Zixibacteria bacterium]|nr:hypothetical protein [candidate division Zixibacteria bacterium]
MAEISGLILERVRRAVAVAGRRARVRAAYVFGSVVEGTADQESDIDVAVFIDETDRLNIHERAEAATDVQLEVGSDMDLHLYSARLLNNPPPASFAKYIQTHGVKVALD